MNSLQTKRITIVIPIFNGYDVLQDCFASLQRHTNSDSCSVLLIDDASPDPRIETAISNFVSSSIFSCQKIKNETNLGFVGTVNRAMRLCEDDVLLLNSDTLVTPHWLERISACAENDESIATITPWSNNAEICSFPLFCQNNPIEKSLDEFAKKIVESESRAYPDLPTGVGFCMYLRRAALRKLGDFDQATFGKGYGEENDFCMRAAAHGWRNVLCDDAYVAHRGGASFADTDSKPGGENLARLLARYPRYNNLVADFIAQDSLRVIRERIIDFMTTH